MAQMACLYPRRGNNRLNVNSNMLPLHLTAAWADWFSSRRISRLPFGDRVLCDSPALSSLPGHTPTQDDSAFADRKDAASGPTSAIIFSAERSPKPGTSRSEERRIGKECRS